MRVITAHGKIVIKQTNVSDFLRNVLLITSLYVDIYALALFVKRTPHDIVFASLYVRRMYPFT